MGGGNVRQTSVCRWLPPLAHCRKPRQTEVCRTFSEFASSIRADTAGEFGERYGTGSGSDLVDSEVAAYKAPGRYRSPYTVPIRQRYQSSRRSIRSADFSVSISQRILFGAYAAICLQSRPGMMYDAPADEHSSLREVEI